MTLNEQIDNISELMLIAVKKFYGPDSEFYCTDTHEHVTAELCESVRRRTSKRVHDELKRMQNEKQG